MSDQSEAKYMQEDLERARAFFIGYFGNGADARGRYRAGVETLAKLIASVRAEAQQALVRIDEIPQQEVDLGLPKTAIAPVQEAEKKTVESLEIFLFEAMWKSRSNWKLEDGTDARTFCHHWAKGILHFMESENSARLASIRAEAQQALIDNPTVRIFGKSITEIRARLLAAEKLAQATKTLSRDLHWYANKHGLGPAKVLAALVQADLSLAEWEAAGK